MGCTKAVCMLRGRRGAAEIGKERERNKKKERLKMTPERKLIPVVKEVFGIFTSMKLELLLR